MPILGGDLAYKFLRWRYPAGKGVPMNEGNTYAGAKLKTLWGMEVLNELKGKTVMDFGCGTDEVSIELAQYGCRVIGIDIQEHFLEIARKKAEAAGVGDRCTFVLQWNEPGDVVISTDAFEHFEDPEMILRLMQSHLKPGGYILLEFGPTWLHPHGGHLFSVFPWAHLLVSEEALIRWRADFKNDGAKRFEDVAGGLNRMTISRWEEILGRSTLKLQSYELKPIQAAKSLHCGLTREFLTAIVRARLVPNGGNGAASIGRVS
jgi:SAM-dependent methyltransferase